jgi:hypothetical protein
MTNAWQVSNLGFTSKAFAGGSQLIQLTDHQDSCHKSPQCIHSSPFFAALQLSNSTRMKS